MHVAVATANGLIRRAMTLVKRVSGMPDYDAYLEHLRVHHPESPVPSERAYFDEYLKGRYGGGFSRCC